MAGDTEIIHWTRTDPEIARFTKAHNFTIVPINASPSGFTSEFEPFRRAGVPDYCSSVAFIDQQGRLAYWQTAPDLPTSPAQLQRQISVRTGSHMQFTGLEYQPPKDVYNHKETNSLTQQAMGVLNHHCFRCHGEMHKGNPDLEFITTLSAVRYLLTANVEPRYLVPGNSEQSFVYMRIRDDEMPPQKKRLSSVAPRELALIEQWINSKELANYADNLGVTPPATPAMASVGATYGTQEPPSIYVPDLPPPRDNTPKVIDPIRGSDLVSLVELDRRAQRPRLVRYITLHRLANEGATDDELNSAAAAVSKTINMLHKQAIIVLPERFGPRGVLLRIDLTAMDWELSKWDALENRAPERFRRRMLPAGYFVMRALSNADMNGNDVGTYYRLLGLPRGLRARQELYRQLGIDNRQRFVNNQLMRAYLSESGVSAGPRVLERYEYNYARQIVDPPDQPPRPLWVSYEFRDTDMDINNEPATNPLGPRFGARVVNGQVVAAGNPFNGVAFEHNYNELIGQLPNGMPFFMITESDGERRGDAPDDIASDPARLLGPPNLWAAASCVQCHTTGIVRQVRDEARSAAPFGGPALAKVRALYPPQEQIDAALRRDEASYLMSIHASMWPFLTASRRGLDQIDEPCSQLIRRYLEPVSLERLAIEWETKPERLAAVIRSDGTLQRMGLRPLLDGLTVARKTLHSRDLGGPPVRRAAQLLGGF